MYHEIATVPAFRPSRPDKASSFWSLVSDLGRPWEAPLHQCQSVPESQAGRAPLAGDALM
jgi:hypothetical protein